jgi:hypothetical protein
LWEDIDGPCRSKSPCTVPERQALAARAYNAAGDPTAALARGSRAADLGQARRLPADPNASEEVAMEFESLYSPSRRSTPG